MLRGGPESSKQPFYVELSKHQLSVIYLVLGSTEMTSCKIIMQWEKLSYGEHHLKSWE